MSRKKDSWLCICLCEGDGEFGTCIELREVPILAETYLGGAITCDDHHMTDPHSDGLGVCSCIEKSLEDAGVYKHDDFSSSNFLLQGHILSTGGAAFTTSSRRPVNTAGFSN
jgi:hypothetical protein